ncbi:hypothetical protein [Microbulbifer variabilis]|uniref:hypothetical protein n=1 Tax=Microbulbifer variabilis TaxID=266805 RepID=UPI001CFC4C98|nr:hypothetical protein [Microbulbifer variabilis]
MRYLLSMLLSVALAGCVTLPSASIPDGGVIAIIYETPDYICHDHTGITVFGNFVKYYNLPSEDIERAIFEGYKLGFEQAGYKVVRKKTKDLFGDLAPKSNTNLSPQEVQRLVTSASKENVSLVLYADAMAEADLTSSKPPLDIRNYCEGGTILFTGPGQFRAEVLAYSMDTTAFDARSGQNLGRLHYHENPTFSATKPSDLKNITEQDLERFLRDLKMNASFKASLIVKNLTGSSI